MILHIPNTFPDWYGQPVVVARGPRRSIYLYTPKYYKELEEKIDENAKKYGLTYPNFKQFISAGTIEAKIEQDGTILLPNFLIDYLPRTGAIRVEKGPHGLKIDRERANECLCDDSTCGKCLVANCRDMGCEIHTPKNKALSRLKRR